MTNHPPYEDLVKELGQARLVMVEAGELEEQDRLSCRVLRVLLEHL